MTPLNPAGSPSAFGGQDKGRWWRRADLVEPVVAQPNEPEEHAGNVLRMRRAVVFGFSIWALFGLFDWYAGFVYHRDPTQMLAIRFGIAPVQLAVMWRLLAAPTISAKELKLLDLVVFPLTAGALGWMTSYTGGLGSPYDEGVFVVFIARGAFMMQPWWQSWVPNLAMVLAHLAAVLLSSLFHPALAAQLSSTAGQFLLASTVLLLTLGGAMMTLASHTAWEFRRRVFQARLLGRYRLDVPIGEGGHGQVWKARHTGLNVPVAVKILKGDWLPDSPQVRRFQREARAMFALKHPNTVRVLDYGATADGVCYLAMELLEGSTLAQIVARDGPLTPARALHVVLQAANALAEAHALGMVHRDVKPENLLITRLGDDTLFCKLLDFGIALLGDDATDSLTCTGKVFGTPGYIAPEVLCGAAANPRADVYALGAVLQFAITGQAPRFMNFEGIAALRPAEESSEIACLPSQAIAKDLKSIIERCQATVPAMRFANAGVLAEQLRQCTDAATAFEGVASASRSHRPREAHFVPTSPMERVN